MLSSTILMLQLTAQEETLNSHSPAREESSSRQQTVGSTASSQNYPCLIADRKCWLAQGTAQAPAGQGGRGSNNHADEVGSRLALLALALRA